MTVVQIVQTVVQVVKYVFNRHGWCRSGWCLVLALLIAGCSHKPPPTSDDPVPAVDSLAKLMWPWQSEAITLNLQAAADVNTYNDEPHTLALCVYQLSNAASYVELSRSTDGLGQLMDCTAFNATVIHSQRVFIQPGEQQSLKLDRYENTRFIAIVAGYAEPQPTLTDALYKVPIKQWRQGLLFWQKTCYQPSTFTIDLTFGAQGIKSNKRSSQ